MHILRCGHLPYAFMLLCSACARLARVTVLIVMTMNFTSAHSRQENARRANWKPACQMPPHLEIGARGWPHRRGAWWVRLSAKPAPSSRLIDNSGLAGPIGAF